MDSIGKFQKDLHSEDATERRQARRAHRQKKIYTQLREAVTEANEAFRSRNAHAWSYGQDRGGMRKLEGNPAAAAAMYVTEALGEFRFPGTLKTRCAGLKRDAGAGGHGITDGVVLVDVEIRPTLGMTAIIEVPVIVKNGYMLTPGLFTHQGQPYVLSQSALDDVLDGSIFSDPPKGDRRNAFSPPAAKQAAIRSTVPAPAPAEDDGDVDRSEYNPHGFRGDNRPTMDLSDHIPSRRDVEQEESRRRLQIDEQGRAERLSKERRKQRLERERLLPEGKAVPLVQGKPIPGQTPRRVGELVTLAQELMVPTSEDRGVIFPEGAALQVLATSEDGYLRVRDVRNIQVLVDPSWLV